MQVDMLYNNIICLASLTARLMLHGKGEIGDDREPRRQEIADLRSEKFKRHLSQPRTQE